ncbi:MAG: hypothetical protein JSV00_02255, partial [bacterium]
CLARAVALCEGEGVDHLVATPLLITRGFWERLFVPFFSIALVSRFRIWRASRPRSRFYAGIGAFTLVRRSLYETAGTHGAIRGEAVDDLLLGRLVKRAGGRQKLVAGEGCLRVRWNVGLSGLLGGLEKNAYAGFGFNPYLTVAGCLGLLCLTLLPAAAPLRLLWAPGGPAWWAGMAGACVWGSFALLYRLAARGTQTGTLYFLTFPLGALLLCWAIARSALMYHLRGGIRWRGTVYRKGGI